MASKYKTVKKDQGDVYLETEDKPKKTPFTKGNKFGFTKDRPPPQENFFKKGVSYKKVTIDEEELREKAYESYLCHIASGKSPKSWFFDHPDYAITHITMDSYVKKFEHLCSELKQVALAKSFGKWEQIVMDSAEGKNKKINTATLQMLMRNRFKWDSKLFQAYDESSEVEDDPLEALSSQLNELKLKLEEAKNDKVS